MLNNANVLSVILLLIAVLVAVGWFMFGALVPFYLALILTAIGMVIMVAMLATFPKDPS